MSTIFISHSSQDNAAASELEQRLAAWGYTSIFLDFDPEKGIPTGRDWEQELYHQLRTCGAVLVLCSAHSMTSYWCFAEITHAKALGKHVFPLKVAPCDIHPVLAERQVLDLTLAGSKSPEEAAESEASYRQLRSALRDTLGEGFPWPPNRPPYPGLAALQEQDAAIFFGREQELLEGLETLERLRRYGAGRALLVLGASGSGKSSLVRAGLLPRLRRAPERWLIVGPFRPLDRPWRELAIALTRALADVDHSGLSPSADATAESHTDDRQRGWRRLQSELESAASGAVPSAESLLATVRDLHLTAGGEGVKVLLVIDQAEELLHPSADTAHGRFGALLQAALDAPASPLRMLATLRTDLLTDFQHHAATRDLKFDSLRVGPMTLEGLAEVIAGPARVAGIDLEDGLSELLLADADNDNVLPLLAFALRELYERYGDDRRLTVAEYRHELGGLGGSVAKAAESALTAEPLSETELQQFRDTMLAMVQITETGRYARRPLSRDNVPAAIRPVIDRFVTARLLTGRRLLERRQTQRPLNDPPLVERQSTAHQSTERGPVERRRTDSSDTRSQVVEVAHEILFLSWSRLRSWLDEDRELLLWRKRLDTARREWERTDHHPQLLLEGPALIEGERWLDQRGAQLEAGERKFLESSLRRATTKRRRRMTAAAAAIVLLAVIAASGLALWQRAEAQRARAEDAARVAVASEILSTDPTRASQVLLEVKDPANAPFAVARMRQALGRRLAQHQLSGHREPVAATAFSPDGHHLVTASSDQSVRLWATDGSGEVVELTGQTETPTQVDFSPDGKRVLTVADDGSLRVWTIGSQLADAAGSTPVTLENTQLCRDATFDPTSDRILAVAVDGSARIWHLKDTAEPIVLGGPGNFILAATFGPEGERVVSVTQDGAVTSWSAAAGGSPRSIIGPGSPLQLARFSPVGNRLLIVTDAGRSRVLRLDGLGDSLDLGETGPLRRARFSRLGGQLLTVAEAGDARLWHLEDEVEPAFTTAPQALGTGQGDQDDPIDKVTIAPRGDRLVLISEAGKARLWTWAQSGKKSLEALEGHDGPILDAAFAWDGDQLATASQDNNARLWRLTTSPVTKVLRGHRQPLIAATFNPDGTRVLTASLDGTARLWTVGGKTETNDSGETAATVLEHDEALIYATFDQAGERILTASENAIRIWPADGRGEPIAISAQDAGFEAVALAPNGQRLAAATWDGTLRMWTTDGLAADGNGEGALELGHHDSAVLALAFEPGSQRLATASQDGSVSIWSVAGGEPRVLIGHDGAVEKVAFSRDGRRVISSSRDDTARVWSLDGDSEPIVLRGHRRAVRFSAFSPDGTRAVTASNDATVRVWRLDAAIEPQIANGQILSWHQDDVTMARFSRDGRHVVSASKDGSALVWRLDGSGEPLVLWHRDPTGKAFRVTAADFSPDGTQVVTASLDGTARIWLIDAEVLRQSIAATVHGCIEPEFRRNYLGETQDEAQQAFENCEARAQSSLSIP